MAKQYKNQKGKGKRQKKTSEKVSAEKGKNKLSRRKKARAKKTLHKAVFSVMNEIENDAFLRSHLFLNKPEKNKLSVGGYIVTKEENDVYNVYKKNLSNLLYENLYSFDAAMAIAESLNANKAGRIKDILEAEEEYVDRYNDMMSFKYHYKLAKENKTGNEWIYEDRYIVASQRAKKALEGVRRFRIARKS